MHFGVGRWRGRGASLVVVSGFLLAGAWFSGLPGGRLFETSDFVPRRLCRMCNLGAGGVAEAWSQSLVALHVGSDLAIFGAYLAIPLMLAWFLHYRREALPYPGVAWAFVLFIVSCGVGHALDAVMFYWPAYRLLGWVLAFTAVVSWGTVAILVWVVPRLLVLKTPEQLQAAVDLARREVQDREAWFSRLVENASDVVTVYGEDLKITYQSPALRRVLGYDAAGRVGVDPIVPTLVHPEDLNKKKEFFRILREAPGVDYTSSWRMRHTDGSWRLVEAVGRNLLADPLVRGFIANLRDITDQDDYLRRLRSEEARKGAILENSLDAIVTADESCRILDFNPAAEEMFGLSAESAVGRWLGEIFFGGDVEYRDLIPEFLEKGLPGDLGRRVEREARRLSDGAHFPVEMSVTHTLVGGRHLFTGTVRDITSRKKTEGALAQAANDYRRQLEITQAITENSLVGLVLLSSNRRISYMNPAAEKTLGFSKEEALGEDFHDLVQYKYPDGHPFPVEDCEIMTALREGRSLAGFECQFLSREGGFYPVLCSFASIPEESGSGYSGVLNFKDIKTLKQKEHDLEVALHQANMASEAKDRFLAVLSHELRTPLTPVLATVSSLAADRGICPTLRPTLEMLQRNVELEARLIDDILDMTKLTKGKMRLEMEPVDLNSILGRSLEICRSEIHGKQLNLEVDLQANQPWLNGDPARLQQVFWNLLKNAVKFTGSAGTVKLHTADIEPGRVRVTVEDSGVGIEHDELERVFLPFEQGERKLTRKYGGLGLGLAICKSLVEGHGGEISAYSAGKDRGAKFHVDLPTCPQPPSKKQLQEVSPVVVAKRCRLLLVEDNKDTLKALSSLLRARGYDVQAAMTVQQGLDLADVSDFDLVLSDIGLPDGTGFDLMRELRDKHGLKGVAMSGYGMEEDLERGVASGFSTYLTKPVSFQKLESTILRYTQDSPESGDEVG